MDITISLKEALQHRPAADGSPSKAGRTPSRSISRLDTLWNNPFAITRHDEVTCRPMWTAAEFRTFVHLTERCMSTNQRERHDGMVWMARFRAKHGEDICDMMLAELRRRDAVKWFSKAKLKGA